MNSLGKDNQPEAPWRREAGTFLANMEAITSLIAHITRFI
jgi:hypothetical protein